MEKFNFISRVVLNGENFHQHDDEVNSFTLFPNTAYTIPS